MLEIRTNCENCNTPLPNDSDRAMICSFECTFCSNCVEHILENVCPNCGGGFEKRPSRPKQLLAKYPTSTVPIIKSLNVEHHNTLKNKFKTIPPNQR